MKRRYMLFLFVIGSLMGCATKTDPDWRRFEASFTWSHKSRFTVNTPAEVLCRRANDATQDRRTRCEAVACLFASYVKPGFTAEQMRSAIPDNRWLSVCSVENDRARGGGGWLIHFSRGDECPYVLRLFPLSDGWSDWIISFSLPNLPSGGDARTVEEALAFLSGTDPDKQVTLGEFAIWFPISGSSDIPTTQQYSEERFTNKGVGSCRY
jgi:hypothetical protein